MTKTVLVLMFCATSMGWAQAPPPAPAAKAATSADTSIPGLTERQSKFFRRFDRDEDMVVSEEEYRNAVVRLFNRIDADHSGSISLQEVKKFAPAQAESWKLADVDKNHRVTLEEFTDVTMSGFRQACTDPKKGMTPEDFKRWQESVHKAN